MTYLKVFSLGKESSSLKKASMNMQMSHASTHSLSAAQRSTRWQSLLTWLVTRQFVTSETPVISTH